MILEGRPSLTSYMARLLSEGQGTFSALDAQKALGVSRGAFLDAAEKRQRRGQLISPRRGFYVIVPPQYLASGAPPPTAYIDALMRHEAQPYYVGLNTAAELHGAPPQTAPQFQVVTAKRLPEIKAGRITVAFYYRKDMHTVAGGVESHETDTGYMEVSSPELTSLDLMRYPNASRGLDDLSRIVSHLASRIDPGKLATLSTAFERSVVQRLGFLLSLFGHAERVKPLHQRLMTRAQLPWVELEPAAAADLQTESTPPERDQMWRVIVRRVPKPDVSTS
jgi:hypothetical protein